jgi:hypothetical protein
MTDNQLRKRVYKVTINHYIQEQIKICTVLPYTINIRRKTETQQTFGSHYVPTPSSLRRVMRLINQWQGV